ncbi:MAG: hypothetical protein ABSF92_01230 [Candidatus Acidiferrales bacterium]|jgi:hypothetical protein
MRKLLTLSILLLIAAVETRAATPTFVQSVSHSDMSNASIAYWKMSLPNPTQAGNAIVMGCAWGSSSDTISVTDDKSNGWTSVTVVQDGGNGESLQIWYALNVASGTRLITVTPSASELYVQCMAAEFYNVATSSAADGSAGRTTSGTSISTGSFSTGTAGDLIFHWTFVDSGPGTTTPLSFASAGSFSLLTADGTSYSASQYEVQGSAGSINPTITTGVSVGSAMTSAIALKAASAGSAPAAGIRVQSIQEMAFPMFMSSTPASFALQVPSSGNLIVVVWNGSTTYKITGLSSTPSNTWSHTAASTDNGGSIWIWYAANASTASTMTVTITQSQAMPAGNGNIIAFYDVAGAATSSYDTYAGQTGTLNATSGTVTGPSITPSTSNGVIIGGIQENQESACAVSTGYFDSVQTDQYQYLSLDADGGYMHYYNPNTSAVNVNWTYCDTNGANNVGPWWSQVAAFKAPAAGGSAPPPTQMSMGVGN